MTEKKAQQEKEQELQQKLLLYQLLQAQLEELKKQAALLQARFIEIESTRLAVEDVKKVKENNELLIPLGSGMYVNGKMLKGDLLVDIGAGIMTKKPAAEADTLLETKKKEIESLSENLQKEMMAVIAKINEIGEELQKSLAEGKK